MTINQYNLYKISITALTVGMLSHNRKVGFQWFTFSELVLC